MKVDISVPEVRAKISAPKVTAETGTPIARRWVERDPYEGSYSITPSASAQVLDTEDKYMTGDLTINAIPADYVGPSVPTQGATTITPTTSEQTAVAAGKYTTGAVKVGPIPPEYIIPTGTLEITENETGINVADYAEVDVAVPDSNFIVTIEWDDENELWVPDKTYAEIEAAWLGNLPIVTASGDPQYVLASGYFFLDEYVYYVFQGATKTTYKLQSTGLPTVLSSYDLYDTSSATISDNGQLLSGVKAVGADGALYTGNIPSKSSSDLSASGATVTVPAGHYASQASKSVASGTEGTPSASKSAVSNHAVTVTPSVTNAEGYISGGTHTGTPVSVSASELVSGSETKTANGTYDVTNLAELVVDVSGGGGGATQHTIHLEFSDNTDADIEVDYDNAWVGSLITSTEPTTYGAKTVILAQLDGVTWYEYTPIPLNTQLIDFTAVVNGYTVNASTGEEEENQWSCCSDFVAIDPSMTFSYVQYHWFSMCFYSANHGFISSLYVNDDMTELVGEYGHGTLSGNNIPSNAAYVRLNTNPTNPTASTMSLIRTA